MLVLSRKSNQRIVISETVVITILNVQGNRVRIGVEAPPEVVIRRSELPPKSVRMPVDFPAVAAGTTVSVGTDMTGTFAVATGSSSVGNDEHDGEEGRGGHSQADETEFVSILQGTGLQLGYVQFETELHRGSIKSELGISVNSLTPNASLDLLIGGVVVGQILTDANGHGDLDVSSLPSRTGVLPFPVAFPDIATGTTIQIGTDLSGTFTVRS